MQKIDRKALVQRHNPILREMDMLSPLTIGNGEFAFTADITGMQTFYEEYQEAEMPLCTMAQWGWHTTPFSEEEYICDRNRLIETEYDFGGRKVYYPVKCAKGNEQVYDWLRQNPHKCNLIRIALAEVCGQGYKEFETKDVSHMQQTLHMDRGLLDSRFQLKGEQYHVESRCAGSQDTLAFQVTSKAVVDGRTGVLLAFPYGNTDISGSNWGIPEKHETKMTKNEGGTRITFIHEMDREAYCFELLCDQKVTIRETAPHSYLFIPEQGEVMDSIAAQSSLTFSVHSMLKKRAGLEVKSSARAAEEQNCRMMNYQQAVQDAESYWENFWNRTGVIQLCHSKDERALELERRIVQSQYLMAVNCCGSMPPQETGLTCNSWYGKAHLEMYFWHEAYLPFYGRTDLLMKSLDWFVEHLPEARANAAKNGYKGARWTKMVAYDGIDSPSKIAPLLVWQQPHLIYMIYTAYMQIKEKAFLEKYYAVIAESAEFMADFAVKNEEGLYELAAPLIPVQERHAPEHTKNPVFEVEYWVLGLRMAAEVGSILGKTVPQKWMDVAEHMIPSPQVDGYYIAQTYAPDTFVNYHIDHPSMLMAYGVIDSGRIDKAAMAKSLELVLDTWDEQTLWGWDFAVMAMTAVRLGKPELAIDLILKDTFKNKYVTSGNNRQVSRNDLPLYLPGNGSLLLAAACMAAGYEGADVDSPGFPKNGMWIVEQEGVNALP